MSESEEKPFTVNDRRKFTPDGQAREESATTAPRPAVEPAIDAADAQAPREAGASVEGGGERPSIGPVDFAQFLLSLAAPAGVLLSGGGKEEVGDADALAQAQSIISILEMLEDKTRGRRTPDEERLLEDLLFELRMAYVRKRGKTGP
jgi:hypothetical protein